MKIPFLSRKSADAGTLYSSATLGALLASVFGGGGATKSGASVTTENSMEVSVVLGCVRVLAEGVAQVPWKVMRREGRNKAEQRDHPLWRRLHRKPNGWQTSFAFRETMMLHALLGRHGCAVVYKSMVGSGSSRRLYELILLDPNRITIDVSTTGERKVIATGKDGSQRTLVEDDLWFMSGPSWDGVLSFSLLNKAREAVGLAMATEETQSNLHKQGVRPSGLYSVESTLNEKQQKDLKKWIEDEYGGQKSGGVFVLDRGAKFTPTSQTGVDAQHLETRKHQVEDICRFYRVLPIMVGQADKAATYASAEQMFLAHLVHSLMPWYERIEQSADCNLLTDAEIDAGYYTLLDPVGLLRGSLKDTAEYITKLTETGVITRNEGREILDRNPLDGLDEPLTPTNMLPASGQGATP